MNLLVFAVLAAAFFACLILAMVLKRRTKRCRPRGVAPRVGMRFGDFVAEATVSSGGSALVCLGRHVRTRRRVAIKCLKPSLADDPVRVERFLREALVLAAVNYEYVPKVLDRGISADGIPFIVMDFVRGETLTTYFERCATMGGVPLEDTLRIGVALANIVDALSAAGVTHCDLKSDNVMIAASGAVFVIDLDVAKSGLSGRTAAGLAYGTPCYMSPEQARGEAIHIGVKTDVFGVGGILYEAVTGERPRDAATAQATLVLAATRPVPPVARRASVPPGVAIAIDLALAFEPELRSTPEELRTALETELDRLRAQGALRGRGVSRLGVGVVQGASAASLR